MALFIGIFTVITAVVHLTNVEHINHRLVFWYHFTFDCSGPLLSGVFLVLISLLWTVDFSKSNSKSKSHCDWRQSVSKSRAHDQIFITLWQLRSCFSGVPSLTRGRVCLLYMLLALISVVFLGSGSLGTRDHILLAEIWDFPFRHLLRLAGSRWRYSNPCPNEWRTKNEDL
jgi:hypothetical protein